MQFKDLNNIEVINLYGKIIKELKQRKIIRMNSVVGDLGERLAIDYYTNTKGLSTLQDAPTGTKYIDAISREGERYTIKSLSAKTTGTFHGLPSKDSNEIFTQRFEYLIIVKFNNNYELEKIIELTWNQFLEYKGWHSTMKAWNISLTNKLIEESKIIFDSSIHKLKVE